MKVFIFVLATLGMISTAAAKEDVVREGLPKENAKSCDSRTGCKHPAFQ